MNTIWVVQGTTGEYSDRDEWIVVAVNSQELAEEWIKALDIQYQSIPPELRDDRWEHQDAIEKIMSLDPKFRMDYTGTSYFYSESPFSSADPAPLPSQGCDET